MKTTTDYTKQATDFLKSTNTTFKAEFKKHGKHFEGDKENRDIYTITLERGSRKYVFDFGQSINNSHQYTPLTIYARNIVNDLAKQGKLLRGETIHLALRSVGFFLNGAIKDFDFKKNKNFGAPTAYDVLACLTKYDVGSFEDFCSEFGYDTDSKSAEKTYKAVVEEFDKVCALWSDEEIEQLQEIQ